MNEYELLSNVAVIQEKLMFNKTEINKEFMFR